MPSPARQNPRTTSINLRWVKPWCPCGPAVAHRAVHPPDHSTNASMATSTLQLRAHPTGFPLSRSKHRFTVRGLTRVTRAIHTQNGTTAVTAISNGIRCKEECDANADADIDVDGPPPSLVSVTEDPDPNDSWVTTGCNAPSATAPKNAAAGNKGNTATGNLVRALTSSRLPSSSFPSASASSAASSAASASSFAPTSASPYSSASRFKTNLDIRSRVQRRCLFVLLGTETPRPRL